MRILITDLAAYNAGRLNEVWLDPFTGEEQLTQDIDALLAKGPVQPAEEWAVHAYEDLPNLGEHPTLEELVEAAEAIDRHGEAMRIFIDVSHAREGVAEKFRAAYQGEFGSHADFAEHYLEESGLIEEIPEWIQSCIDYQRYWNSSLRYDFYEEDGHYFWRNL